MDPKVGKICVQVKNDQLVPDAAVKQLVAMGLDEAEANEIILFASGGSDLIVTKNGKRYFVNGSKLTPVGPDGWPVREKP